MRNKTDFFSNHSPKFICFVNHQTGQNTQIEKFDRVVSVVVRHHAKLQLFFRLRPLLVQFSFLRYLTTLQLVQFMAFFIHATFPLFVADCGFPKLFRNQCQINKLLHNDFSFSWKQFIYIFPIYFPLSSAEFEKIKFSPECVSKKR